MLCCAEGTVHVKKDTKKAKHDTIDVPNLHVMQLLLSLKSRGFVKETFNWQYLFYSLTDEGITYLREYLSLPAETVPSTLKVKTVERAPRTGMAEGPEGRSFGRGRGGGLGAGGYRSEGRGRGFGRPRTEGAPARS